MLLHGNDFKNLGGFVADTKRLNACTAQRDLFEVWTNASLPHTDLKMSHRCKPKKLGDKACEVSYCGSIERSQKTENEHAHVQIRGSELTSCLSVRHAVF